MGQVQKALLSAVIVGGIMLIGGTPAPRALGLLGGKRNSYKFKYQAKNALAGLVRKGYVTFVSERGGRYARITTAGQKALALLEHTTALDLQKRKKWDKRWRVVIFDIPERRRGIRDRLRAVMRSAGFYRLQDSVWLYPYDCEDFVALLKADLRLGLSVLYMIVERIESDSQLKEHYSL